MLKLKHIQWLFLRLILVSCIIFTAEKTFSQTDKALVELANEMFSFGDYEDALGLYLQAVEENPSNVTAQFQAGECYLVTTHSKSKAITHFLKAFEIDPEYSNMILFKIAESYRFAYNFDEAIKFYGRFEEEIVIHRRNFSGIDLNELEARAERRIYECKNAKEYIRMPTSVKIENMGSVINSEHNDYAPVLSPDQLTLIFTSRRAGGVGVFKDVDNKYFEDLWMSNFEGGKWLEPTNLGSVVNSDNHESNLGLSPSGTKLYIYKAINNGDIYFSDLVNGEWTKPKPLGKPINSEHKEISAFESSDGKYLFISSDRPGGIGKADIYWSKKTEKGLWGEPELLSSVVNTPFDEEGPFFVSESNMLYFSSKGHKGMGGYDLYRSQYNPTTGEWSDPQNLGYPINSTDDDLYFVMSGDGKTAYYASFKDDSRGENDIYKIYPAELLGQKEPIVQAEPEDTLGQLVKADESKIKNVVLLKFNVYDMETDEPVKARIELVDKESDMKLLSREVDGYFEYEFTSEIATTAIVLIESDGYLFQTVKISIPGVTKEPQVIQRMQGMKKPRENVANIMRNVYFDFNKATLQKQSYNEIDKLAKMMNENPSMKIELAGHTDFIGGAAYNKELSRQRASAVRDYLISKGINASRITAVGHGSERPLASNDDESEGRELNRRTEFTIISK